HRPQGRLCRRSRFWWYPGCCGFGDFCRSGCVCLVTFLLTKPGPAARARVTMRARHGLIAMPEATITLEDQDEALLLYGSRDQNLRAIRDALGVRLVARGNTLRVEGSDEQVDQAERVFQQLRHLARQHGKLSAEEVRTVLDVVQHGG